MTIIVSKVLIDTKEGAFYVAPLNAGIEDALKERNVIIRKSLDGYHVSLCDGDSLDTEAEFGNGPTLEYAWRYALGAFYGPLDDEYPGDEAFAYLFGGAA